MRCRRTYVLNNFEVKFILELIELVPKVGDVLKKEVTICYQITYEIH